MKVTELVGILGGTARISACADFEVRGLSANSKNIADGYVFVAVRGAREDGARYIREALEHGARAVVTESVSGGICGNAAVPVITVKDSRAALGKLAAAFYGYPAATMSIVGVTGTNGKTTVTYLLESLLKKGGRVPGVIGTINYRYRDTVVPAPNTTPGPLELQALLSRMGGAGVSYAVMEVSSHALDQGRVAGLDFHSAIFTNITQDHLDYHKTLEQYFQCKARLFSGLGGGAFAVINNDDPRSRELVGLTRAKIVTYGIDTRADVRARDMVFTGRYTTFSADTPWGGLSVRCRLIGRHNVYNILAAAAWAGAEGFPLSLISAALDEFTAVPGRLEQVFSRASFSVFVDYAHTEDALRNCLLTLRPLASGRVIVVFGCGGERDSSKRPNMGRVAAALSDYAVITTDNPRSEDPAKIIDDILKGFTSGNYSVVVDRRQAIARALSIAREGDVVLVAGKGHEAYQIIKDSTVHFDDREEIRACLQSMNY